MKKKAVVLAILIFWVWLGYHDKICVFPHPENHISNTFLFFIAVLPIWFFVGHFFLFAISFLILATMWLSGLKQ
ncbi:MAG: hypothetical protein KBC81_03420 [Candidatus Pacebacteria bacterium]|nr:hypothetical protein [Candidatus Paceibacterota bacterium]